MENSRRPRPAVARELPSTLYLETTNRCDSKCQTCIRTFTTLEPPSDLTLDRLVRIVEQHPTLKRAVLHGIGEPLLNKELFGMIDYLKARGVEVTFNSDAISLTDSKIERDFVTELDTSKEVAVYAKLPRGFFIPTPVGNYNPDWAIAFTEGSVKHVYFVAETKGSLSTLQLKGVEDAKLECARKFFTALNEKNESDVTYGVVTDYAELMQLVVG